MPGLLGAEALEQLERLVGLHLHEVHLELGVEEDGVGRGRESRSDACSSGSASWSSSRLKT